MKPIRPTAEPIHDWAHSPLYQLAVLTAARHSGDKALERLTLRHLASLGVRIAFADELTPPARRKGAAND